MHVLVSQLWYKEICIFIDASFFSLRYAVCTQTPHPFLSGTTLYQSILEYPLVMVAVIHINKMPCSRIY